MSGTTTDSENQKKIFSLRDAREVLPVLKQITDEAVNEVQAQMDSVEKMTDENSEFPRIRSAIDSAVNAWAEKVTALGGNPKGLWLVDFDNGEGYYCWRYPEDVIDHFHSYDQGFSGRSLIC